MSPIRCIRFILFWVSCDLSALLFLCGRYQKNTKFEGWADHVTGKAGEGFRAWCSEYIPILWRDQTHWICATFGHYVINFSVNCMNRYILVYRPSCLIGSLDCAEQEMHAEAKIPPTHFYAWTICWHPVHLALSQQPWTPYICNTGSILPGTVFILSNTPCPLYVTKSEPKIFNCLNTETSRTWYDCLHCFRQHGVILKMMKFGTVCVNRGLADICTPRIG